MRENASGPRGEPISRSPPQCPPRLPPLTLPQGLTEVTGCVHHHFAQETSFSVPWCWEHFSSEQMWILKVSQAVFFFWCNQSRGVLLSRCGQVLRIIYYCFWKVPLGFKQPGCVGWDVLDLEKQTGYWEMYNNHGEDWKPRMSNVIYEIKPLVVWKCSPSNSRAWKSSGDSGSIILAWRQSAHLRKEPWGQ